MQTYCKIGILSGVFLASAATPALARGDATSAPASQNTASKPRSAQETVLELEHSLLQARVTTSTAVHEASFAEEGVYIHSSGWAQNRNEVLEMVAKAPWARWTNTEEEVHLYGDLAVTHSLLTVLLTDKRTETVRTTGVYVRQSGKWRQVSWQSSIGRFVGP